MKAMLKEIIIILLLILAIVLVLGVVLYDYIPTNKVVPKVEAYEPPDNIKEELEEVVNEQEDEMTPIVYEINGSDLKIYEKQKDYQKGKVNPFEDSSTNTNEEGTTNGNTNSNTTNTGTTPSNSNKDSGSSSPTTTTGIK